MLSATFGAILFGALVAATPTPAKPAATSCTFTDAAKASASKAACSTIVLKDITVPAGTTLDMTNLNNGTKLIFQGTTTFGYTEWSGPLISVSGSDLTISGAPGHLIDGNGPAWWDGLGSNGGKTKPKFFAVHSVYKSTISNLNVKNTPVQGFSINTAADVVVDHVTIDNSAGDVENGGHNTDAFDVGSSSGITISNANITNQDDCLAVNSGTNIHFIGGSCVGGHGLSIGSVGGRTDNTVSGVLIEDSLIANSQNGVRIKTVYDATGNVNNITYRNIKLQNITKYGIVLEQDYENGSPTGTPTTGVPITDLTLDGVTGTVDKSGTNIYILCGAGSCSNWTWKGVSVTGGQKDKNCTNIPSGASC